MVSAAHRDCKVAEIRQNDFTMVAHNKGRFFAYVTKSKNTRGTSIRIFFKSSTLPWKSSQPSINFHTFFETQNVFSEQ